MYNVPTVNKNIFGSPYPESFNPPYNVSWKSFKIGTLCIFFSLKKYRQVRDQKKDFFLLFIFYRNEATYIGWQLTLKNLFYFWTKSMISCWWIPMALVYIQVPKGLFRSTTRKEYWLPKMWIDNFTMFENNSCGNQNSMKYNFFIYIIFPCLSSHLDATKSDRHTLSTFHSGRNDNVLSATIVLGMCIGRRCGSYRNGNNQ